MRQHLEKLAQLATLRDDWNGYGAPRPSPLALGRAARAIHRTSDGCTVWRVTSRTLRKSLRRIRAFLSK